MGDFDLPGFACARHYSVVTSTMDVARGLLLEEIALSPDWCAVIVADDQSAGRGRQGRSWLSNKGSLMATFIFVSDLPLIALAGYSLAVGVGVARVLNALHAPASLKWPNDIVVLDRDIEIRKLGGILIEVQEISGKQCILVGLGVNIREPPIEVRHIGTSLKDLEINFASQSKLLADLAEELKEQHEKFCRVGFSGVQSEWMKYSCFVKNRTRLVIDICSESVSGVYAGVSEVGALLLNVNGEERAVHSGHIMEVNL